MPVEFDPLAAAFIEDPYPTYARLRAEDPVHRSPLGTWVVSRYAEVDFVLRDPRFGRAGFAEFLRRQFGDGPLQRSFAQWLLFMDPPGHDRLRALAAKAFTPGVSEELRPRIQRSVDELLAPLEAAGEMDVISALAHPLPVAVICDLLGVPTEDRGRFDAWSAGLAGALDAIAAPTPDLLAAGNAAAEGLTAYFRELVEARRSRPGPDLLSALIAAEEEGSRLSEDELLATCVLLFFAGHETTVNLIGNGLLALLRHPEQLARLAAEPGLVKGAVEECLRYDGPVQRMTRIATADVEIGGQTIRAGERVTALVGSAGRDAARFADADRLDVARADHRHLAFGAGIHYCLGAPLARVEGQVAIGTLVRRFRGLTLRTNRPAWRTTSLLRGLKALPVGWDGRNPNDETRNPNQ